MKKLLLLAAIIAAIAIFRSFGGGQNNLGTGPVSLAASSSSAIARAFTARADGISVEGQGDVVKVLPDDTKGSRHQRFIVRLDSGQTVLIAHNIDVAPRVAPLAPGDSVSFSGEYVWNDKGGIIHWTHHDPGGTHASGWIKRNGQVFQ